MASLEPAALGSVDTWKGHGCCDETHTVHDVMQLVAGACITGNDRQNRACTCSWETHDQHSHSKQQVNLNDPCLNVRCRQSTTMCQGCTPASHTPFRAALMLSCSQLCSASDANSTSAARHLAGPSGPDVDGPRSPSSSMLLLLLVPCLCLCCCRSRSDSKCREMNARVPCWSSGSELCSACRCSGSQGLSCSPG